MTNSQKSIIAFTLLVAVSVATVFGQTERGFDPSNMDKETSACTDFYQYANGTWLKKTAIPAAYPSWGSFNVLAENNRKTLHTILEEAARKANVVKGSNEQKIGDFYASCLDEAKREAEGMKPLVPELARIDKIADAKGVAGADSLYAPPRHRNALWFWFTAGFKKQFDGDGFRGSGRTQSAQPRLLHQN